MLMLVVVDLYAAETFGPISDQFEVEAAGVAEEAGVIKDGNKCWDAVIKRCTLHTHAKSLDLNLICAIHTPKDIWTRL